MVPLVKKELAVVPARKTNEAINMPPPIASAVQKRFFSARLNEYIIDDLLVEISARDLYTYFVADLERLGRFSSYNAHLFFIQRKEVITEVFHADHAFAFCFFLFNVDAIF